MSVCFEAQPEVADIVRLIHCLQHRAHQHGLDQIGVRAIHNGLQYALVVFGLGLIGFGQYQPQLFQVHAQIFQLVRIGAFMYPVQHRQTGFGQKLRRAHVGGQHTFLDQTMRIVAHHRHNFANLARLAKHNTGFLRREIQRTGQLPGFGQLLINAIQGFQMRNQRCILFTQTLAATLTRGRIRCLQNLGNLGIGQPRMRKNHTLVKPEISDFTGTTQIHLAHHHQAIHLRLE